MTRLFVAQCVLPMTAIATIILNPLSLNAETLDLTLESRLSKSAVTKETVTQPTATVPAEVEIEVEEDLPIVATEMTPLLADAAAPIEGDDSADVIPPSATEGADAATLLTGGELDHAVNAPIAQVDVIDQTIETRYRLGYLGVGANLGLTGDTGLSDTGFAVFSKIPLETYLSLRPAVIFSEDVEILLPATFDFQIGDGDIPDVLPYAGAGLAFSTGDNSELDLLLSGGIDIPIGRQFTATAGLNIAPFNSFDMGVLVGIAYNFEASTVTSAVPVVDAEAVREAVADLQPNPSYLGVGFNLGITGDSALGDDSFAVLSKISFNPFLSVRPELLIDEEVTFLIPVTYDLPTLTTEFITFAPYLGAGISFSTGDNSNVDLLASAGVDIPITSDFAATLGVNLTPFDSFDLGARLGLVYLFESF
jgi:opacity protein-like surface antigen